MLWNGKIQSFPTIKESDELRGGVEAERAARKAEIIQHMQTSDLVMGRYQAGLTWLFSCNPEEIAEAVLNDEQPLKDAYWNARIAAVKEGATNEVAESKGNEAQRMDRGPNMCALFKKWRPIASVSKSAEEVISTPVVGADTVAYLKNAALLLPRPYTGYHLQIGTPASPNPVDRGLAQCVSEMAKDVVRLTLLQKVCKAEMMAPIAPFGFAVSGLHRHFALYLGDSTTATRAAEWIQHVEICAGRFDNSFDKVYDQEQIKSVFTSFRAALQQSTPTDSITSYSLPLSSASTSASSASSSSSTYASINHFLASKLHVIHGSAQSDFDRSIPSQVITPDKEGNPKLLSDDVEWIMPYPVRLKDKVLQGKLRNLMTFCLVQDAHGAFHYTTLHEVNQQQHSHTAHLAPRIACSLD